MATNQCQCAPFETCGTCNPEQTVKSTKILKELPLQCRCGTCNPDCLKITVMGGTVLTLEEAKNALQMAMYIIECVGTTGIDDKFLKAEKWMKRYFPAWA